MSTNADEPIIVNRCCPPHCKGEPQEPCVWTLEADADVPRGYAQLWQTACGHWAGQYDDRGDWCTWCGKRIEIKEAKSAR